jgi:hypothetical protein
MSSVTVSTESFRAQTLRHHWVEVAKEEAPWLTFVVFYAVFANLPHWIASRAFGFLPLGCFCVEYAIAGLIALVVPRFVAAILFLAVVVVDVVCGVCLSYYLPVQECLANLSSAHAFSAVRLLWAAAAVVVALLAAASVLVLRGNAFPTHHRLRAAASLTAIGILIFGTEVFCRFIFPLVTCRVRS